MRAGVREDPPGSNASPRIRMYGTVTRRREKPPEHDLTADGAAWCAKMVGFGVRSIGLPGEAWPTPRVSGVEYEDDAKEQETWHSTEEVLAGLYAPEEGDLVICNRPGPAWARHVCVLVSRNGGSVDTIGGNEGDRVGEATRALQGGGVRGFVSVRQVTQVDRSRGPYVR